VDGWFSILDRYGIPGVILAGVAIGCFYVLRRLFAKGDGILTAIGNRHIEYLDEQEKIGQSLARSNERLTTTAELAHKSMSQQQETIDKLVEIHGDPDSTFATVRLNRSGLHACDALEAVARSLGVSDETDSSIASIRRELGGNGV
jgi:hypothetical protein